MIFEGLLNKSLKNLNFLWPPCDPQIRKKPLRHNNFSLYGIQEVSGSIPLISTRKFRKALILLGFADFLLEKIFSNFE